MQVPSAMVDAALKAHRAGPNAINAFDAELILEAVLSMARERLRAQTPYSAEMHEAIDYAFDHAFPEDES